MLIQPRIVLAWREELVRKQDTSYIENYGDCKVENQQKQAAEELTVKVSTYICKFQYLKLSIGSQRKREWGEKKTCSITPRNKNLSVWSPSISSVSKIMNVMITLYNCQCSHKVLYWCKRFFTNTEKFYNISFNIIYLDLD